MSPGHLGDVPHTWIGAEYILAVRSMFAYERAADWALVLLMAGPATNMATITMVGAMLGRRTLAIYLGSIVACTLALGYFTDIIYAAFGISAQVSVGKAGAELISAESGWKKRG